MYALQLIGYGNTESGELFWVARNNRGQDWGESGYIRILRGENICGIGSQVYQPSIVAITITTRCCANKYTKCSCTKKLSITQSNISSDNHQHHSLLILVRHGISVDELEKRYSGWHDCDLADLGKQQMYRTGQVLRQGNFSIDICFTSLLKRAIKSLFIIQQQIDHLWIPVHNIWRLNDRMLGNLTCFHCDRAQALFGENQIKQWLTQSHLAPPPLQQSNILHPRFDYKYRHIQSILPSTETFADVQHRLLPFFSDELFNNLYQGQNILLVTHEEIIKTIIRLINNFTLNQFDNQIIPIGIPIVFHFSRNTHQFYNGYYLSSTLFENNITDQHHFFPTGFNNGNINTNKKHTKQSPLLNIDSTSPQQKSYDHVKENISGSSHPSTDKEQIHDAFDSKIIVALHDTQQPAVAMLSPTNIALDELATSK